MKKRSFFLLCTALLYIVACASDTPHLKEKRPDWFYKPSVDGRIGGIGIAGRHIQGLNAQKTLAIQRAIDDIAKQLGVEVKNITEVSASGNRDQFKSEMVNYSIQTVSGENVRAVIRAIWEDPENGQFYVWMTVQG